MAEDHYQTLGVCRTASQAEILQAYRQAARRCHPDLHPQDPQAIQRFYRVQRAFEVLGDPEKRWGYNRSQVPVDTSRSAKSDSSEWREAADAFRALTRYAVTEVAEPALGLVVATALGVGLQYLAFFELLLRIDGRPTELPALLSGPLGLAINLLGCILGVVVLLGAIQMRKLENYRFAVVTSVIATLCCCSPWFLLGMPFGIWALVVLCNERIRDAFWS